MDNKFIFRRAEKAMDEAFEKAVKLIPSIALNQTIGMEDKYPPAWVISSDEFNAQSVACVSTHKKNGYLVLRFWSPFWKTGYTKDKRITTRQEHIDFIYTNEMEWDSNADNIANLIWNWWQLLYDWHMTYSSDFEGFDISDEKY